MCLSVFDSIVINIFMPIDSAGALAIVRCLICKKTMLELIFLSPSPIYLLTTESSAPKSFPWCLIPDSISPWSSPIHSFCWSHYPLGIHSPILGWSCVHNLFFLIFRYSINRASYQSCWCNWCNHHRLALGLWCRQLSLHVHGVFYEVGRDVTSQLLKVTATLCWPILASAKVAKIYVEGWTNCDTYRSVV